MDLYTPAELQGVIETLIPEQNFFLDNFFQDEKTFTTEEIAFDKIESRVRIAPFVAPNMQGKPQKRQGYKTDFFKPAYVKPKNGLTPNMAFPRKVGEPIGQPMSPQEKWDALITKELADQEASIRRRWEWMAMQATLNGAVTVVAEDYPSTTVDFGRDPDNTVTLTGTVRWGQADADPIDDLEAWAGQIQSKTGAVVTTVYMAPDVWRVFRKDPDVKELLEIRRGSAANGEIGPQNDLTYKYVLTVGTFDIYVYSDSYVDETGTDQKMMPDGTVLMVAPRVFAGVRCFGAILDSKAGLQALPIFSKMWDQEDPSVTFVMSQSAPLMVPRVPDASLRANVL